MPQSIVVAIVALGLMISLQASLGLLAFLVQPELGTQVALGLALSGLVMWGMIAGHRLAWQWGRLLGLLAAIGYTLIVFFTLNGAPRGKDPAWLVKVELLIFAFLAACLWTIFFALGRNSAKEHFGLRCSKCAQLTNQAADFFFNRAKCKSCGTMWR